MEQQFQPIRMLDVITQEVGTPRNDSTRGSTLYSIPIRLSERAPHDWGALFVDGFDNPPQWTSMHRPGIASVQGDRIVLDATTMEELEKTHLATLKLALEHANREYLNLLAKRRVAAEQEKQRQAAHRKAVDDAAKKIKFD